MGGLNVKNTMIERVLQFAAPHPCFGCGKVGSLLCPYCKYDIVHEPFLGCILCGVPCALGICWKHESPIEAAFTVGAREGVLKELIDGFKFERMKSAAEPLAELLDVKLPYLPKDVLIVPIPTVRSHVRTRGYDQVGLLAQYLCARTGYVFTDVLLRTSSATQHVATRRQRELQAQHAFDLREGVHLEGRLAVLVDDIVTTGATLSAAARVLHDAGARVWVVTLAYQPLD